MYLQKVISKKIFVNVLKDTGQRKYQDPNQHPDPEPLVRGMDPRILIHTTISWIRNTATKPKVFHLYFS